MSTAVLIVDDEEGIRKSLASYLKMEGFDVDTAANGREALEKIRSRTYKVVLLDINMPGLDGIAALENIKAIDFSIQVVMMTASSTFEKTMQSLEHGANDFLVKPFDDIQDVLALVKLSEDRLQRWQKVMAESIARKK